VSEGIITKWNDNPATVMGSDSAIVNFTLQWKDNNSTSKHVLSIDDYNHDTCEDTPNHESTRKHWFFCPELDLSGGYGDLAYVMLCNTLVLWGWSVIDPGVSSGGTSNSQILPQ